MGGGCYSSKKHDGPKTELGGLLKGIGRVLEAAGGGFKCSEENQRGRWEGLKGGWEGILEGKV